MGRNPHVRRAVIEQSAPGSTVLVAGIAGRTILVKNYALTMTVDGTLRFLSGSSPLSGPMSVLASGGFAVPGDDDGWFETAPGEDLSITTTSGRAHGHLSYERSA